MKKPYIFLTSAMLVCMLSGCAGNTASEVTDSSKPAESSQSTQTSAVTDAAKPAETSQSAAESKQTDIIYAYFNADRIKEYPIEYIGEQKNPEELAQELSDISGLDFNITASKTADGWKVDWAADSTLIAGLDGREQKEDFFDSEALNWFMMDSLWQTLTKNLDADNIYYTMDGGKELTIDALYPVEVFPSDIPYMGSEFYFAHTDLQGDDVDYSCTKGLWRMDGATDTASIEMNGFGGFTMYYADGSVEAVGNLKGVNEEEIGYIRYEMYNEQGELIVSFCFDSETQFHLLTDAAPTYVLDTQSAYQGLWQYSDGKILEINGGNWSLYEKDGITLLADGTMKYNEDGAGLINADGSSGGGSVYFDENNSLVDSGNVLTYIGSLDNVPRG